MWIEADMSLWRGRVDDDSESGKRWHQCVRPAPHQESLNGAATVLGFACDEGVRRNQGRVGAVDGPDHIRRALANLPWRSGRALFDAGTVHCAEGDLETAQTGLAEHVADVLHRGGLPVVLGGGHEVAWGSYQGLRRFLSGNGDTLGVINFDAHFDLRDPAGGGNSGTPFRQMAEWCEAHEQAFPYLVLGINPAANMESLFSYARLQRVAWFEDIDCVAVNLQRLQSAIDAFIAPLQSLYLTICLDAFPASLAPGVSAPGVPGICPHTGLALLRYISEACTRLDTRLSLVEVAEMNPRFDQNAITARWAARLVDAVLG